MNEVRSSPILNLEKSRSCLAREALGFGLRERGSGPLRKADPEPMERDAGSGNGSRLDSSKRTQSKWDAVVISEFLGSQANPQSAAAIVR